MQLNASCPLPHDLYRRLLCSGVMGATRATALFHAGLRCSTIKMRGATGATNLMRPLQKVTAMRGLLALVIVDHHSAWS